MARYPMSPFPMPPSAMFPFRPGGLSGRDVGERSFLSLHRQMNRLFDDFVRSGFPGEESGGSFVDAHMDVSETDDHVRVCAELPGVKEEDVEVMIDNDVLTIRGEKKLERKDDKENFHLMERSYGTFRRALRLPYPVDADQVQASFDNGVLTVTLPKAKGQERTHRIQVQKGSHGGSPGAQAPSSGSTSKSGRKGPGAA